MTKILTLLITLTAINMSKAQNKVYITANGKTRSVILNNNAATRELKELLETGSFTVRMSDYGGFEKVGALPRSFTTSNSQITTSPGDIMLYQGNQMVIFYGTNSWSYTPLGKIEGATADNVKDFLGIGSVEVTVSLTDTNVVGEMTADSNNDKTVYDLNGRKVGVRPLSCGVYIINGKKTIIP